MESRPSYVDLSLSSKPSTIQLIWVYLLGYWYIWFLIFLIILIFILIRQIRKRDNAINQGMPTKSNRGLQLILLVLFLPIEFFIWIFVGLFSCQGELTGCTTNNGLYFIVLALLVNIYFIYHIFKNKKTY